MVAFKTFYIYHKYFTVDNFNDTAKFAFTVFQFNQLISSYVEFSFRGNCNKLKIYYIIRTIVFHNKLNKQAGK